MFHPTHPAPELQRPAFEAEVPRTFRAGVRWYAPAAQRFLVIAAVAFWLGGFTFYAGVAVPTGVEVLGSHKIVGFVTQRVTNWLNVAGVCGLAVLLWNAVSMWGRRGKLFRTVLLGTWALMAVIQVELILMHPAMDRLLITEPHRAIIDEPRFESLHRVYLVSTTVQWAAGLLHVWCICLAWGPTKEVALS